MLHFIINPKANRGKIKKKTETVEKILTERKIPYAFHYTTAAGVATDLARRFSQEDGATIVAIGGDGTINEVLNGIDTEKASFGIIPSGSGNDFVASAKIPLDTEEALELILKGEAKPTDYMLCGGIRGLNVIGTGIDVDILKRCRSYKILRGKLQYLVSLIVSLIKFKFYKFFIPKDGKQVEKEGLIVAVGNGRQFGGGIRICPKAEIDDGLLDFVVAGKLKKIRIPGAFMKLMKGKILELDFTSFERCERVKIDFDKPVTIQIDGELYDGIDFDVSVVKGGIKIFRP
ncbi:MAG: diacylglycerol kinase family lipid kinase [Clostridiales bacterium]|nr:diacylglycerol kinase family lipid kinase [Clostridiales bacterium]